MKLFVCLSLISLTLGVAGQESEGKKFLDQKRGWQEFCVGQTISEISSKIKPSGKNNRSQYKFQATTYPNYFDNVPIDNIMLASNDSISISSVTINLGVVCSDDFQTNTKFKDVVNKLSTVFGDISKSDYNESLGEFGFFWIGKTTVCGFATIWDATKRHYTGAIVFYPKVDPIEERKKF